MYKIHTKHTHARLRRISFVIRIHVCVCVRARVKISRTRIGETYIFYLFPFFFSLYLGVEEIHFRYSIPSSSVDPILAQHQSIASHVIDALTRAHELTCVTRRHVQCTYYTFIVSDCGPKWMLFGTVFRIAVIGRVLLRGLRLDCPSTENREK